MNMNKSHHDSKLFIGDSNQVRVYDFRTNKSSLMHEIIGDILTFDVTDSATFYVEKNLPIIQSVNATHNVNVTFTKKVEPQAIAVDFLTKKFYLIDRSAKTVNVMDFEGKFFKVIFSDLEDLHDIVLDIEEGFMFILQYNKSVKKLYFMKNNYIHIHSLLELF